jgi:hypothetical protein
VSAIKKNEDGGNLIFEVRKSMISSSPAVCEPKSKKILRKPFLLIASFWRHATHILIINWFICKLLANYFMDEVKFDVHKNGTPTGSYA